ncbi:CDP-glycerol glycerophosphotransferase family protein [Marinobacter sp. MMG032]|uniref:CDP-glycerol glycerophosphotransferase family protein n=1 Tax=Marinobacter sp. MMG032 TaxID=3158548 RepID=A0AAU7ML68_9GAMM
MKIKKNQLSHWLLLIFLGLLSFICLLFRLLKKKNFPLIILYGHQLNGNLFAIYKSCPNAIFLTMDWTYYRKLRAQGVRCQWLCSFGAAKLVALASALISDHGLHSLEWFVPMFRKTGLKFFDVWHGIPFKGFDSKDFKLQHQYDEIWVASPLHKELYTKRFGFSDKQVAVTGYPRTDDLVSFNADKTKIRKRLGLPLTGTLILFAPTWAQDSKGRNVFPFGQTKREFLGALSAISKQHNATILVRTHLNTETEADSPQPGIISLPGSQWPDTESILQVSDILICDWSSIAFDFLLLDRPTFFLDVTPPFKKGFSLGPEYRFGSVINTLPDLLNQLDQTLASPDTYWRRYSEQHASVKHSVYGEWADGKATARCLDRIARHTGIRAESSQ